MYGYIIMKEKRLVPKAYRRLAEVAAEHYAYTVMDCLKCVRAVKSQYQTVDFWASDIVGKRRDGTHVYIQVTSGQASAVSTRKAKLEDVKYWHHSDTVLLLQLYWEPNPQCKRGKLWYFKVWEYVVPNKYVYRTWVHMVDHAVPVSWFKCYN